MRNHIALMLAPLLLIAACGGGGGSGGESDSAPDAPGPATTVDASDAFEVAEAFYGAIDAGDLEGAARWILPEQQQSFVSEMQGVDMALPEDYEVVVFTQDMRGEASIAGTGIEMDMQMAEGRWWMCR